MSLAHSWGTRPAERALEFPCDGVLRREDGALYRGVDIDAAPAIVYRWLCQMRAAPYSYDWLDNFGRRSPQQWTPGLDELRPGQRFMAMFELVSFEPDRHVTIRTDATGRKLFGDVAVSYLVAQRDNFGAGRSAGAAGTKIDDEPLRVAGRRMKDHAVPPQELDRNLCAEALALPRGPHCRLLVKLSLRYPRPPLRWLAAEVMPWLDLLMMRRQLLNFKALAERSARSS